MPLPKPGLLRVVPGVLGSTAGRGEKTRKMLTRLPLAALIALTALPLLAAPAQAGLFKVSIFTPGDDAATRDTVGGLDWLDPGVLAGFSYNEVLNNAGGLVAGGWRYATTAEVCGLMVQFGLAPAPCPGATPMIPGGATLVHLDFLGVLTTLPFGTGTAGYFDDGNPGNPNVGIASVGHFFMESSVVVADDSEDPDQQDVEIGSFLVRAAPPTIPALPAPALPGLAALLLAAGYAALGGRRLPVASRIRSAPSPARQAKANDSGAR